MSLLLLVGTNAVGKIAIVFLMIISSFDMLCPKLASFALAFKINLLT
jgi:hypothetical protein